MDAELSLMIMSPENILEECTVSIVRLPGKKGRFEVLKSHAPLISSLEAGDVEYVLTDGETRKISIKSGFVEVRKGKVSVCVEL